MLRSQTYVSWLHRTWSGMVWISMACWHFPRPWSWISGVLLLKKWRKNGGEEESEERGWEGNGKGREGEGKGERESYCTSTYVFPFEPCDYSVLSWNINERLITLNLWLLDILYKINNVQKKLFVIFCSFIDMKNSSYSIYKPWPHDCSAEQYWNVYLHWTCMSGRRPSKHFAQIISAVLQVLLIWLWFYVKQKEESSRARCGMVWTGMA